MSNNILYTPTGSAYNTIYIVPSGQTAEEVATQGGWAPTEWAAFDAESYIANYNDYKQAFSIVDNLPLANTDLVPDEQLQKQIQEYWSKLS